LNPIVHIWYALKRHLTCYPRHARNANELWEWVQEEWLAIPVLTCARLVVTMLNRIQAVIDACGGHTKY
jgi:hypothetical protein